MKIQTMYKGSGERTIDKTNAVIKAEDGSS